MKNVAILGASAKPHRYSHMAQVKLQQAGYAVFPVSATGHNILNTSTYTALSDIKDPIDTVTIYVRCHILDGEIDKLVALRPRRVIFNPGSEAPQHQQRLREEGILVEEACTLVLLSSKQFD